MEMLAEIFERLRLPAVPGEILAGIALGPFALNWISASDTLRSLARVGAIFVLFSAGLVTCPRDLIRVSRKALLISVLGVVAPFVLGFGCMKLRGAPTVQAVFVAPAMVATSIGITARALANMKVLSGRTARIILGAAVFDDILGMLVLAIVAGAASGKRCSVAASWCSDGGGISVFPVHDVRGSSCRSPVHLKMERLSTQDASLVVALAICLLLSWLAATIGMAAIVGAFFAGLTFADYALRWNRVSRVGAITSFLAAVLFLRYRFST